MKTKFHLFILFLLSICLLGGCGGYTKSIVPDNVGTIPDGYARIVVTREQQISGAITPIYILDMGKNIEANADIAIRIGEFIQEKGLDLWYTAFNKFKVEQEFDDDEINFTIPTVNILFKESSTTSLDDLIDNNANAIIFVDHLKCYLKKSTALYCGDGKSRCDSTFVEKLNKNQGILVSEHKRPLTSIAADKIYRAQVIGSIMGGDTIIWDRKPGVMRAAALWGGTASGDQDLLLTQGNIVVEAGRTYYLHYSIKFGERWKIMKIE